MRDTNQIELAESRSPQQAAWEMARAKVIGTGLVKAYPGREWSVQIDAPNQMANIFCVSLNTGWGYTLFLKDISPTQLEKAAVYAGGEILERFNISRDKKFDNEALDEVARDARGNALIQEAN